MKSALTSEKLLVVAAALYCGCLIVSNTIAGKTFDFFGIASLPCAVVIFPIVYIVNDMLTEVYGFKCARTVILTGFAANLIAVVAFSAAIALPGSEFFANQDAFSAVLGNTPRMLIASFAAYLIGSFANAKIMELMKRWDDDKLMLRCVVSTLAGETLDATVFITIGFAGTMPVEALLAMVVAQAAFKTVYEVIVYPLTRKVIFMARALPKTGQLA